MQKMCIFECQIAVMSAVFEMTVWAGKKCSGRFRCIKSHLHIPNMTFSTLKAHFTAADACTNLLQKLKKLVEKFSIWATFWGERWLCSTWICCVWRPNAKDWAFIVSWHNQQWLRAISLGQGFYLALFSCFMMWSCKKGAFFSVKLLCVWNDCLNREKIIWPLLLFQIISAHAIYRVKHGVLACHQFWRVLRHHTETS